MVRYNAALQRIVRAVRKDIDEVIVPLVKQYAPEYVQDSTPTLDGWADTIARALQFLLGKWLSPPARQAAESIASEFVKSQMRVNSRGRRSFGIDVFSNSQQARDYLEAATFQNAMLITSIPAQYLEQVQNIVMTNMRAGMRPSFIEKALSEQFGVTSRRAKMIARDQHAKVQGELNKRKQVAAGFEMFQWVDSHDQRVRHRHREIANKVTQWGPGVYRWDDLPLSAKGEPIAPGADFQCRCIAKAITQSQVDRYVRDGLTKPGVTK
jgi:SPP1 gp7 family putative phage head morphogenesis protein